MAKNSPTDSEILAEMDATGGDDYFAVEAQLQRRLNEEALAIEKLKPLAEKNDVAEPWSILPSESAVLERMATYGVTYQTAFDEVKAALVADARRLNSCAPESAAEISEALAEAEAAKERAEFLLAEHEATLSGLTSQIFALGKVRRRIAVAKSLALNDAGARHLAHAALNYFVEKKVNRETVQNVTGFRSNVEDLSFRQCLNNHITDFVAPLESQAVEIEKAVRAEVKAAKISLVKVLSMLAADRGVRGSESLDHDSSLYAGLT